MEILRVSKKAEFNRLLQDMQEEVVAFGFETRDCVSRKDSGDITRVYYEVYWDGKWVTFASEIPFVGEDNDGTIHEDAWNTIRFQATQELATS